MKSMSNQVKSNGERHGSHVHVHDSYHSICYKKYYLVRVMMFNTLVFFLLEYILIFELFE